MTQEATTVDKKIPCQQTYREMRAVLIIGGSKTKHQDLFVITHQARPYVHHTFPKPTTHKDRASDYDKFA